MAVLNRFPPVSGRNFSLSEKLLCEKQLIRDILKKTSIQSFEYTKENPLARLRNTLREMSLLDTALSKGSSI